MEMFFSSCVYFHSIYALLFSRRGAWQVAGGPDALADVEEYVTAALSFSATELRGCICFISEP